jgi:FAD/FMN-containing dehydrogenase
MLDEGFAPGAQVYWSSVFLQQLTPETADVIARQANLVPSPSSAIVLEHLHGAMRKVAPDATAFIERNADFNVAIVGACPDPADVDRHIAWARETKAALEPFATGAVYVNYLGVGDEAERVADAYGSNYERLAQIKQKYDPENLFRANQNIRPRA